MNNTEFYRLLAAETGMTIEEAKATCAAVFGLLGRCIKENDRILIKDFGVIKKKHKKEHKVGNPKTGGTIAIPAHDVVVFNEWGYTLK